MLPTLTRISLLIVFLSTRPYTPTIKSAKDITVLLLKNERLRVWREGRAMLGMFCRDWSYPFLMPTNPLVNASSTQVQDMIVHAAGQVNRTTLQKETKHTGTRPGELRSIATQIRLIRDP